MSIFLARNFGLCLNLEGGRWAEINGERLFCLGAENTFLSFLFVVGSCWLPHLMDQYPHLMTATFKSKLQYTQQRQMVTKIANNIFLASEFNCGFRFTWNIYSCPDIVPGINYIYSRSRFTWPVNVTVVFLGGGGQKLDFLKMQKYSNAHSSFDERIFPDMLSRFAFTLNGLAANSMNK